MIDLWLMELVDAWLMELVDADVTCICIDGENENRAEEKLRNFCISWYILIIQWAILFILDMTKTNNITWSFKTSPVD